LGRMATAAVFIHGAGRAGRDAWPNQAALGNAGWHFLERHPEGDDADRDAERVSRLLSQIGGGHVVAHSYGAIAALLAAATSPDLVASLALVEPACFDLARGMPAVEAHITAMGPVFAAAKDPSLSPLEFSRLFAEGMGVEPPDLPRSVLEARVGRLRELRPPWGTRVTCVRELSTPTLVLTGGWSPLYEQTAESLVRLGAVHRVLRGHGHRAQDHPDATEAVSAAWR
jgi:pimeloyl-ACP methyl ester carboxylesterase